MLAAVWTQRSKIPHHHLPRPQRRSHLLFEVPRDGRRIHRSFDQPRHVQAAGVSATTNVVFLPWLRRIDP
jgi:hypothetical protein